MMKQSPPCIAFVRACAQVWVAMAEHDDDGESVPKGAVAVSSGRWRRVLLWLFAAVLVLFAAIWLARERIADNLIASQLKSYGIPATYNIEQIGPSTQILTDIVIGSSVTIPVRNGRLLLGTWQGVYFCEFDGPRARRFYVQIQGEQA